MRSVFAFLRDVTEGQVAEELERLYPWPDRPVGRKKDSWGLLDEEQCYLWIYFADNFDREFDPEEWAQLVHQLGAEPTVVVMADVTSLHPGHRQVLAFLTSLLQAFTGVAMDDYTLHLWSLEELQSGHYVEGHPFFDSRGWSAEIDSRLDDPR